MQKDTDRGLEIISTMRKDNIHIILHRVYARLKSLIDSNEWRKTLKGSCLLFGKHREAPGQRCGM